MPGFQPSDLYEIKWLEDVQLSPDGTQCAYVIRGAAADGAGYVSAIWVADLESGSHRRITRGDVIAATPRWSPDGSSIAFISNRAGGNQIWLVSVMRGEERQITTLPGGASEPAWSPDGTQIACVSKVPALDHGDDNEAIIGPSPSVRVVRRLKYKWDGKGWWDGRYSQIFVLSLCDCQPRQMTCGDFDHRSPAWSPDGARIALVANRAANPDLTNAVDIWLLPKDGGELVKLTNSEGPVVSPVWSPNGKTIAYLGHDSKYERQTCMGIYLVDVAGGPPREALTGFDFPATGLVTGGLTGHRSSCAPLFTKDGDLLFISTISGSQQIQILAGCDGAPMPVTQSGSVVYDMSYNPATGRLAYLSTDPSRISDLFLLSALSQKPIRLTSVNDEYLAQRSISIPERMIYPGSGGGEVESWLYKPQGFDPGRKYPLILFIHGGSSPCHGYSFNLDFQVLASEGFIVFAPNERGSQGYGQEWSACIKHVWCGPDYEDLMLGMDKVVELSYVDPKRLGVTGGSFGGLMTNWAVTHTNRFAAAVTQRSTSNRYSNWGTCDEGIHISEYIYPCDPWDDPAFYMERSPAVYVRNVQTPLLILHSEQDFRCNLEQAEQFYRALKRLGKTVEMVVFLGESHELSRSGRPMNRVERMRQIRRWFRKYLKA